MEDTKTYLNLVLDSRETDFLSQAKEKSGIKNNADLIRFLIKNYVSK